MSIKFIQLNIKRIHCLNLLHKKLKPNNMYLKCGDSYINKNKLNESYKQK